MKSLPLTGSSPSQRAASTRKKCPLEKISTSPLTARDSPRDQLVRQSDLVIVRRNRRRGTIAILGACHESPPFEVLHSRRSSIRPDRDRLRRGPRSQPI